MNTFNKKQISSILSSDLTIHWWNMGSKTVDFRGTAKEYLELKKVKYTIKSNNDNGFEILIFKVKFSVGGMREITFTCHDLEDVIRMVININLSYLGDKSKYTFLGRTRSINF